MVDDNSNVNKAKIVRDNLEFNSDMCFTIKEPLAIKALTFGWMPSWWKHHYGLVFGDRYFYNVQYRLETAMLMDKLVSQRYQSIKIGDPNPHPEVILPNLINATTVATAGGKIKLPEDNFPVFEHMSLEELENLTVPEKVEYVFPYNNIIEQVELMNKLYGKNAAPYLWKNGVANDMVQLRGTELFLDLVDDTPIVKKLRDWSLALWMKTIDYNIEHHSLPPVVVLLNCTVPLIGPVLYEKQIFETDMQIINKLVGIGQKFQLHHCGLFDDFIPIYRRIPHVDMLQIGFTSDVRKALDAFPEAYVEYILSPYFFRDATREQVREKINEVLEISRGDWNRFSLALGDIDVGFPDENIIELYECCKSAK